MLGLSLVVELVLHVVGELDAQLDIAIEGVLEVGHRETALPNAKITRQGKPLTIIAGRQKGAIGQ